MLEAHCLKCGETFNPADENDTIHGVREDGEECGGQGVIDGEWMTQQEALRRANAEVARLVNEAIERADVEKNKPWLSQEAIRATQHAADELRDLRSELRRIGVIAPYAYEPAPVRQCICSVDANDVVTQEGGGPCFFHGDVEQAYAMFHDPELEGTGLV